MSRRSGLIGMIGMLGVCAGLGYVVQNELAREPEREPAPPAAAPATDTAAPARPPRRRSTPIRAYSETLNRPLFHTSRRPPPREAVAAAEAAAVNKPELMLVGVLIVPEGRSALIRRPGVSEVMEVSVGERIEGWRLETIEANRIVLKSGKESAAYRLDAELR